MAILPKGSDNDYLLDYKHDRIPKGLDIGCPDLDKHLRFKRGQYNGVLGGNNVGKTYWISWYFLCLSLRHGLKWCLWMDENKKGRALRDLLQWRTGKLLKELTDDEIIYYANDVEQYFSFVDNKELYKPDELFSLFKSTNPDGVLIDPFNQLDRIMSYDSNNAFIRDLKQWSKVNDISTYLTMHPSTTANRRTSFYPSGHEWEGQPMMPLKHEAEGGSRFSNSADDWINLHRLNKLASMKFFTMIDIDKIKDVDTGGEMTTDNIPIMAYYNYGRGFMINGVNPLAEYQIDGKNFEGTNNFANLAGNGF